MMTCSSRIILPTWISFAKKLWQWTNWWCSRLQSFIYNQKHGLIALSAWIFKPVVYIDIMTSISCLLQLVECHWTESLEWKTAWWWRKLSEKLGFLMLKKTAWCQRNLSRSGCPPHQESCQNATLKLMKGANWSHPTLIFFQRLTPYNPLTRLEHQLPHILPYLLCTTLHHNASLSWAYHQSHFPNKALLNSTKSLTPKPPFWIGS